MNITTYIQKHWDELPKSKFDQDELVIFKEIRYSNEGYGHHDYEGVGVNKDGQVMWAYSSGCSCQGSVNIDHKDEKTVKTFIAEWKTEGIDWKTIDFNALQVSFESYW